MPRTLKNICQNNRGFIWVRQTITINQTEPEFALEKCEGGWTNRRHPRRGRRQIWTLRSRWHRPWTRLEGFPRPCQLQRRATTGPAGCQGTASAHERSPPTRRARRRRRGRGIVVRRSPWRWPLGQEAMTRYNLSLCLHRCRVALRYIVLRAGSMEGQVASTSPSGRSFSRRKRERNGSWKRSMNLSEILHVVYLLRCTIHVLPLAFISTRVALLVYRWPIKPMIRTSMYSMNLSEILHACGISCLYGRSIRKSITYGRD